MQCTMLKLTIYKGKDVEQYLVIKLCLGAGLGRVIGKGQAVGGPMSGGTWWSVVW